MALPPPILDDLKDSPKIKLSRKSTFCLIVASITMAFGLLLTYTLDWTKDFHEYLVGTFIIAAAIGSLVGVVLGAMSLIKNEEDMLFQLAGIIGNGTILFLIFLGVLSAFAPS